MKLEEWADLALKLGVGGGVGASVRWIMTRGERQAQARREHVAHEDARGDEQYSRLLEECKRKTEEIARCNELLSARGVEVQELRAAFNRLQESYIPQATENTLMRIERKQAVESLEYISEALGRQDVQTARNIVANLLPALGKDIVLTKAP